MSKCRLTNILKISYLKVFKRRSIYFITNLIPYIFIIKIIKIIIDYIRVVQI